MTVDDPLDVTNSTRHPPYVSVRGSSSFVQDGRNSHIDLLSQVLRELRLDSASKALDRVQATFAVEGDE